MDFWRVAASIRSKLILSFAAILLLVGGLMGYGIISVSGLNAFVSQIYDEPLMGINHARTALAKFNKMRAEMKLTQDFIEANGSEKSGRIETLMRDISADLTVVGERLRDDDVARDLLEANRLLAQWYNKSMTVLKPPKGGLTQLPMPEIIEEAGNKAANAIDRLVEHAAAYGYKVRSASVTKLSKTQSNMMAIAIVTAIIAITISLIFAFSLSRPIRAATAVAERVAAGDFSDVIDSSRRDELGRLLRSPAGMQVSLREAAEAGQEETRLQNVRFNTAIRNMPQGLCLFDEKKQLVVCNDRFIEIYGLSLELAKPGTPLRDILEHRVKSGIYSGDDPEAYISERLAAADDTKASTTMQELTNGRVVAIVQQPMEGGGWVATHEDITELQRVQEQIAHMAHHDALTGLPNRVLFRERIEQALDERGRGNSFAVLCLDLDRFKSVNDTLGHSIGDELLSAVAERLQGCVRATDTVARLGGDEFAVIQVSDSQPQDATALATRICDAISQPFDLENHQVAVGASVGIAVAPADGDEPDRLVKNADMALYRAKSQGRGIYCFFEQEMDAYMQERRALELDLRKALQNDEFEVHYQPLVNLEAGEVTGFEALLRWRQRERGTVSPVDFIPLAEETGLIIPIGEWVIQQACRDAASWPHTVRVAVNLSPVQFRDDTLVTKVFNALATSGVAAGRLELEITESVLLQDCTTNLDTLHQLRNMGVRIAMDDFGTGYSSLSYLRSFPFDKIKIDRSFVSDVSESEESSAIVNAVANLSSSLGISTTAEGVETEAQLRMVKAAGYTEMQGFFVSEPRPAAEITELFFPDRGAKSAASA